MNTAIFTKNIAEMTELVGAAAYDIAWGYRSSLDAATDIISDDRFRALGATHGTARGLIAIATDQGEEATRTAITRFVESVLGPIA